MEGFLLERLANARAAGIGDDRVVFDAGLDLGKTTPQSIELLAASGRLAGHGPALLLSASNKGFLGDLLGLPVGRRQTATVAACALGVSLGCRVVRGPRRRCGTARVPHDRSGARSLSNRYVEGDVARRAYLVAGDDPGLVAQELSVLTDELRALDPDGLDVVEEYGAPGREEAIDLGEILNACLTPPFFSSLRVVVVRDVKALDTEQQKELVAYLADPSETSTLVLASSAGRPPKRLVDAVERTGLVISAVPGGNARDRGRWVLERVRASGLHLDGEAGAQIAAHLGEDLARLEGIVGALAAAYGPGARLGIEEIEPFLGEAGGVAPYDLTDAIDEGDMAKAIGVLHRMLDAGERHPLQILASLTRHVGAMLRLDGAGAVDERAAAEATGLAPYPAKKALTQSRRLGHERLVAMTTLLADADLDLRGRIGWPPELVVEVLVGRLARMTPRAGARSFPADGSPNRAGGGSRTPGSRGKRGRCVRRARARIGCARKDRGDASLGRPTRATRRGRARRFAPTSRASALSRSSW